MKYRQIDLVTVKYEVATTHLNRYLLLDGAAFKNIHSFIYQNEDSPVYAALFRKTFYQTVLKVSPCLVQIKELYEGLLPIFFETGFTENKGILLLSDCTLDTLDAHFKNYLEARFPSRKIVLFRFYDPMVFDAMAHLHAKPQLKAMLEPLSAIYWYANDVFHCLIKNGEEGDTDV
jgi:hypothetical protein